MPNFFIGFKNVFKSNQFPLTFQPKSSLGSSLFEQKLHLIVTHAHPHDNDNGDGNGPTIKPF